MAHATVMRCPVLSPIPGAAANQMRARSFATPWRDVYFYLFLLGALKISSVSRVAGRFSDARGCREAGLTTTTTTGDCETGRRQADLAKPSSTHWDQKLKEAKEIAQRENEGRGGSGRGGKLVYTAVAAKYR